MRRLSLLLTLLVVVGGVPAALADDDHHKFRANLSGYNEVHFVTTQTVIPGTTTNVLTSAALRGAISTEARGKFRATIDNDADLIDYELSYEGLEAPVTQAHIHFGQPHTVGGIVVWLCETAGTPHPVEALRELTPECPQAGTVTGTIGPSQVLEVVGTGIVAGEFDELVRAIRAGATYANVHSVTFGPGEIRGQISRNPLSKVLDLFGRGHDQEE
jgi:hypothetical protein